MNEKLIRLVIIYKRFQFPHKTEIIYKEEEFEYASEMAESYNLDSLVCMNRFLTYSMKINDDVYKQVFMECIDEIVSAIEILFPQRDEVPNEYREIASVMCVFMYCPTIQLIENTTGIEKQKVIEILWEMAKKGLIRLAELRS